MYPTQASGVKGHASAGARGSSGAREGAPVRTGAALDRKAIEAAHRALPAVGARAAVGVGLARLAAGEARANAPVGAAGIGRGATAHVAAGPVEHALVRAAAGALGLEAVRNAASIARREREAVRTDSALRIARAGLTATLGCDAGRSARREVDEAAELAAGHARLGNAATIGRAHGSAAAVGVRDARSAAAWRRVALDVAARLRARGARGNEERERGDGEGAQGATWCRVRASSAIAHRIVQNAACRGARGNGITSRMLSIPVA